MPTFSVIPESGVASFLGMVASVVAQNMVGLVIVIGGIGGIVVGFWVVRQLLTFFPSWYDHMTTRPFKGAHLGIWYRLPWNRGKGYTE